MIKVITAIGEEKLNEELRKFSNVKVINKDILYLDGIFEVLDKDYNIDLVIIGSGVVSNEEIIKTINLIKKINSKIDIVFITSIDDEDVKKILVNKGIKYILDEGVNIKKLLNKIDYKFLKKENKDNKKKTKIANNNSLNKLLNDKQVYNNQIISVAGSGGVGKSIITGVLANQLHKKYKNILIVDLDILNNSMNTIFGVNKYPFKIRKRIENLKDKSKIKFDSSNVESLIVKVRDNVDLLSGTNLLFNFEKYEKSGFERIINKLQNQYELILVDTSSECFLDNNKYIMKISNQIIFLVEANLVQIQKSKNLLDIYLERWKIDKDKIKIIVNKNNKNSIDIKLLKKIFYEAEIIGKISLDDRYTYLINHECKYNFIVDKKIKKDYEKINNEILKYKKG